MKLINSYKWIFVQMFLPLLMSCDDGQSLNPSSINYPIVAISADETYNLGEEITIKFSLPENSYVLVWIQNANLLSDVESYFHHLVSINYFNFNQPLNDANVIQNGELWAGSYDIIVDSDELGKGIFYVFLVAKGNNSTFTDYKTFQIK